jgi:hypothetical protein
MRISSRDSEFCSSFTQEIFLSSLSAFAFAFCFPFFAGFQNVENENTQHGTEQKAELKMRKKIDFQ